VVFENHILLLLAVDAIYWRNCNVFYIPRCSPNEPGNRDKNKQRLGREIRKSIPRKCYSFLKNTQPRVE